MRALTAMLLLILVPSYCHAVFDGHVSDEQAGSTPAPPALPTPPAPPAPPSPPQRPELGKWWKNSAVVRDLQLSDPQITQIEQTFLSHRLKLIDLRAGLEREETQLKPLMEAHSPDVAKVNAQLDRVLTTRNQLEKENTAMMLDIRRLLSLEQWKKLEEIQRSHAVPPAPPAVPSVPAPPASPAVPAVPPPPPPPGGNEVYVVGGAVRAPAAEYQPLPRYTPEARDAKVEGVVLLECIVRKDGSVTDAKIIKGLGYGLDEAALNAVTSQWRFKPGTRNDMPVNVRAKIEISYRLK
ncbi:MAG TPA: TonB family protein [Acidobacteriota bacterium]|nr:TonB family protein [Acidobacteriota bacterium]